MPITKSGEKIKTKWYNNNYNDCYIAVLKFAKANNAILFEKQDIIHMQVGFKELFISFIKEEKIGIDIKVKTTIFKANRFISKFYLEIGQFLEEVKE